MKIDSEDAAKPRMTAGFLDWVTRSVCHGVSSGDQEPARNSSAASLNALEPGALK